jgi:hypothetical protein
MPGSLEHIYQRILEDEAKDAWIETCTIEELIEYAKEYNLHFEIGEGTAPKYINRVANIKARLIANDIDPDTIRNEYFDNLLGN